MNVGIVVAARLDSSRLPGKALLNFAETTVIEFLLERLTDTFLADNVILATTDRKVDDPIVDAIKKSNIKYYRGSADDLIDRYLSIANIFTLDVIVRVTGDCPFVNGKFIDYVLYKYSQLIRNNENYVLTTKGLFPVGLDIEVFSSKTLQKISQVNDLNSDHREHLTLYMYENPDEFDVYLIEPNGIFEYDSDLLFTLDERCDYDRLRKIAAKCNSFDAAFGDYFGRSYW